MTKRMLFIFILLMVIYSASAAPCLDLPEISEETYLNFNNEGISQPGRDIVNFLTYRQKKAEQGYISLCWTETLIITEDKISKNKTLSKVHSIIIRSPIMEENITNTDQNASCYEIEGDDGRNKGRVNFTTVKETEKFSIKEHKTLFCGAGPLLSEHFVVWPKLNKKQIEISINPMDATKWKMCNEDDTTNITSRAGPSSTTPYVTSATELDTAIVGNSAPFNLSEFPIEETTENRDYLIEYPDLSNSSSGLTEHAFSGSSLPSTQSPGGASNRNTTVNCSLDTLHIEKPLVLKLNKTSIRSLGIVNEEFSTDKTEFVDDSKNNTAENRNDYRRLNNLLLQKNINCTFGNNSDICEEIQSKSDLLVNFKNNSSPTLANLFFPNNTFLQFFRDVDDHSYLVNIKVTLEIEKGYPSSENIADEEGLNLGMIEKSKYEVL
ncbi:hypothetical protein JTB14_007971 [Gonioctena quinquepunctata]|nr:hypothetical protein JTB14_007971 [Gonioctena quinquepunctata]